jgi:AP-3 complex subunit mu
LNFDLICKVENVVLEIPMPKSVLNCGLVTNQGKYTFDPVSKLLVWEVGRIDPTKLPNIRGTVALILLLYPI